MLDNWFLQLIVIKTGRDQRWINRIEDKRSIFQIMNRPKLDKEISIADFKDFYWLKEELVGFCRVLGINSSGGKIDIYNRILKFLENGDLVTKSEIKRTVIVSTFNWNTENLNIATLITDSYKNTENVREFFQQNIGKHFKFNVEFMNWMKSSQGKTLGDAVEKWIEIAILKKGKHYKTEISPQFEYNTYMREFLSDNPHMSSKDAVNSWKIKRNKPGVKKYEKDDLIYLDPRNIID